MPSNNKENQKRHSKTYYEKHSAKIKAASKINSKRAKDKWREYKATLSCSKCQENHPATFDFHHEDPTKKEDNIHRLLSNGQYAKLEEELKKCIVLCANCHRIHHYEEKMLNSTQ
jgi:hypothetical protein